MTRILVLVTSLLLGWVTVVPAAGPEPSLWLGASAGAGAYAMSRFNKEIANTNRIMEMSLDEVDGGLAYGLQGGMLLYDRIGLAVGYEWLSGATSSKAHGYAFDYSIPARALYAEIQYSVPWRSRFHPEIAVGVGRISAEGEHEITTVWEGSLAKDYDGEATLWQGTLVGNLFLSKRIVFSPSIGYRKARIHDLTVDGKVIYLNDGSELELDYSGLLVRSGVKLLLF